MSTKASTAALRHIGNVQRATRLAVRKSYSCQGEARRRICSPLFAAVISSHSYSRAVCQPTSNVLLQKQAEPASALLPQ